jgi:hypothetical protein
MKSEIRDLKSSGKIRGLSSRSGQAIVEMLVGLVALLVLITGLIQVEALSSGQTATMVQARRLAGLAAINGSNLAFTPKFIAKWQVGPDGKRYTKDDVVTSGDTAEFENTIVNKASPDASEWTGIIDSVAPGSRENELSVIHQSGMPQAQFGFVKGSDSTNVDLLPAVQDLIYRADSIKIVSDVWMTSTKGIY